MRDYEVITRQLPDGIQNMLSQGGFLRVGDQVRIRAVGRNHRIPFFILEGGGVGISFRARFLNGSSWDESTRAKFFDNLANLFKNRVDQPLINYTYGFQVVRRPLYPSEVSRHESGGKYPISDIRVRGATKLAENLSVQETELYLTITAFPSSFLSQQQIGPIDRIRALWDQEIKFKSEALLLEDVIGQFSDRVSQVVSGLSSRGIGVQLPKTEADLLMLARAGWRPNYKPSYASHHRDEKITESLQRGRYKSAKDFLTKDLSVDQYKKHWISDGCLNMVFSLKNAPSPDRLFEAVESSKFLRLGEQDGLRTTPYFSTYTVTWSSLSRQEGDMKFRIQNAIASGLSSDKKGLLEDKAAVKRANDLDAMHEDFIQGGDDMVRASVTYQVSIPIQHLARYFDTSLPEPELLQSISRQVVDELDSIGGSEWEVEDRTHYPTWINLIPGLLNCSSQASPLPVVYLPLAGATHLLPLFSTVSADENAFNGSNYFLTDTASFFTFDHFSKNNGPAANFSICGSTGSGKSVLTQSLVMMLEKQDPNIMILDFGGGRVGSWTKLCQVMGGTELKFGGANPPLINPFQLNEADSLPNSYKKRIICASLGMDYNPESDAAIESLYKFMQDRQSPFSSPEVKAEQLITELPELASLVPGKIDADSYCKIMDLLSLTPEQSRPGEKGIAAIKIVLTLLLSQDVDEDGPVTSPWGTFLVDDIMEAIQRMYEDYHIQKPAADRWPTLSDFVDSIKKLQQLRMSSKSEDGQVYPVTNYHLLIRRLGQYCVGGLDPFLDGQTNVALTKKVIRDGVQKELPVKFILADMAGISDPRKAALYTITINEFMSRVLYNNRESRGVMIRDEAWLFMKSSLASPYLEADYRLARKYGFSVITIAQQYSDFKSSVLQNNTQNWLICGLPSKDEVGLAHQRFEFSNAEAELFLTDRMGTQIDRDVITGQVKDAYSRVMIANKAGKFFLRNKISAPEKWITTTDDTEAFIFNYYKDTKFTNRPVIELIDWLCTGEYKTDENLRIAAKRAGRRIN